MIRLGAECGKLNLHRRAFEQVIKLEHGEQQAYGCINNELSSRHQLRILVGLALLHHTQSRRPDHKLSRWPGNPMDALLDAAAEVMGPARSPGLCLVWKRRRRTIAKYHTLTTRLARKADYLPEHR